METFNLTFGHFAYIFICKQGSTEYLVLWRGYSPYDCTWEPQENVSLDCIRYD